MRSNAFGRAVAPCLALALVACVDQAGRSQQAPFTRERSSAATALAPTGPTCTSTGAHDKHAAAGFACAVCHACPGAVEFSTLTFPGGTTTAGGVIVRNGAATTCDVGCHRPFGATSGIVAWNAGPLACTACHSNIATPSDGAVVRSSHFVGGAGAACTSCHDLSRHTSGQVVIRGSDGSAQSGGGCIGCHSGQGQTLAGETPPLLVGWADADFHGARPGTCRFEELGSTGTVLSAAGALACPTDTPPQPGTLRITPKWWSYNGMTQWRCDLEAVDGSGSRLSLRTAQPCPTGTSLTNTACGNPLYPQRCYPTTRVTRGFGGTLAAPLARGGAALQCGTCHDFHSSANTFLLAASVNGVAIPPDAVQRNGVGAEALCGACHQGDRHQVCKNCHKTTLVIGTEGGRWFEGDPVDPVPAGSACFYCHGHEGLRFMDDPSPKYPSVHPGAGDRTSPNCSHCHTDWAPPATPDALPPTLGLPAVYGVTATTATVAWTTSEPATTYVEYGAGTAGYVVGDGKLVKQHTVVLTNLTPGTMYVWRVRSSDGSRNFVHSALQSFMTTSADAVPVPDVAPMTASIGLPYGTTSSNVSLTWFAVTPSSGTATYQVQLASDPLFTRLVNGSLAGTGSATAPGETGWIAGTASTVSGRAARSVAATVTNLPQEDCLMGVVPNVYWWRVRAADAQGHVSEWSATSTFEVYAGNQWCYYE